MDIERKDERASKQAGFSLTEMMIVIFIMGLLGTMMFVAYGGIFGESNATKARSDVDNLERALEDFARDFGRYPTTEQGLRALVRAPSGIDEARYRPGGYLNRLEMDPWGNPYQYDASGRRSGKAFDIFSFGADGQEGGEDEDADIGNWQTEDELEGY